MLEKLRQEVYEANMSLKENGLVIFTWGNASGIDRERGYVAIKPSGLEYSELSPENMVIVDLNGKVVEGDLRPSSDTATHLELYKAFQGIGGVVHTHSRHATIWAQAGKDIPVYGTTHADNFYGSVPCTRTMNMTEISGEYEKETGAVIIERFAGLDPVQSGAVLVRNHGPFTWGKNAIAAAHSAMVLEEVAAMALYTEMLSNTSTPISKELLDRHYLRKHGKNAYYGQAK